MRLNNIITMGCLFVFLPCYSTEIISNDKITRGKSASVSTILLEKLMSESSSIAVIDMTTEKKAFFQICFYLNGNRQYVLEQRAYKTTILDVWLDEREKEKVFIFTLGDDPPSGLGLHTNFGILKKDANDFSPYYVDGVHGIFTPMVFNRNMNVRIFAPRMLVVRECNKGKNEEKDVFYYFPEKEEDAIALSGDVFLKVDFTPEKVMQLTGLSQENYKYYFEKFQREKITKISRTAIKEHDLQRITERIENMVIILPVNAKESSKTHNNEYVKSEIIKKFEDQKPDQIEAFVKNQSDEILKHFIQNSGPKHLSEAKLYFLLLTLSRSSSLEKQNPKLLFDFYDTSIVLVKNDFQNNRPKPGSKDQALIIIDEGLRCDATIYINQIAALKMIRQCVRRMPKGPERDDLQKRIAVNAKKLLDQWQNHFLVRHLEDLSIMRPDPDENPKPLENK